jgi:ribose transport system substrate-binding protein
MEHRILSTQTPSRRRRIGYLRLSAFALATALAVSSCASTGSTPDAAASPAAGTTSQAADAGSADASTPADSSEPSSADTAAASKASACASGKYKTIVQVRDNVNPFYTAWLAGGKAFSESVGATQTDLTYDNDSSKQQQQIKQLLASISPEEAPCYVLNILPNNDSDAAPIVKEASEAGVLVVTQWNKPADLHPWDGYNTWVANVAFDGKWVGYTMAKTLFDAMGGEGNIIELHGQLDSSADKDRSEGLKKALSEYPQIKVLDSQSGDFVRAEGLSITKTLITKYGNDINGIWSSNDDMALGALQALETAGMNDVKITGTDAVPEALDAIRSGKMLATTASDPTWQGGEGLALGYCVATGALNVASMPKTQREFYAKQFSITKDNVEEFAASTLDVGEYDCDKVFDRATEPIG